MTSRLDVLPPGMLVDRYVVQDVLGQGGMAIVYRVRHEQLGSMHALKVVAVPSRSVLQRLMIEGRAQARLRHRHIVAVTDVIEVEGCPGLVMEYVDGPSLDQLLQGIPLDLGQVDLLARGIIRGVSSAHAAGVVHRDLKPANVLVAVEDGALVPKVTDFGLAKDATSGDNQTRSGAFMGTPNYMAPEQVRDAKTVDVRADLFALGAILYELLTGERAFDGTDVLDIFNRVARAEYAPILLRRADTPTRMVSAITACLQVDRDHRPNNCDELLRLWCGEVDDAALGSRLTLAPELLEKVRAILPPAPIGVVASPRPVTDNTYAPQSLDRRPAATTTTSTAPRPLPPARMLALPIAAFVVLLAIGSATIGIAVAAGWYFSGDVFAERTRIEAAPVDPEPRAPAPEPVAQAVPVAPVVEPVVVAPPVPVVPSRPRPVRPVPVAPAPLPEPVPDPVPEPVLPPAPEPVAPTGGRVVVSGGVKVMLRDAAGRTVMPGDSVPAGIYSVLAFFDGDGAPATTAMSGMRVEVGSVHTVVCVPQFKKCK